MSDKPVTWSQGVAVVGGAFGICCMGFMLLHGMVVTDRVEAAQNLNTAVERRNVQIKEILNDFKEYQKQNGVEHREIMSILLAIKKGI